MYVMRAKVDVCVCVCVREREAETCIKEKGRKKHEDVNTSRERKCKK